MWRVALQMLMGDRIKYLALVAGVAFAGLLVTQQASIFVGYASRTGSWVRDEAVADLWVVDPQTQFSEDNKFLSDNVLNRVRGVDGVRWAVPMYKGNLKCRLDDGSIVQARVVGIDDATLLGGPPGMTQGTLAALRKDRGVLVGQADLSGELAYRREPGRLMTVGDRMSINDHDAEVVGVFKSTPDFFWQPVIYTTFTRALNMAPRERRETTYVLVKAQPGQDVRAVAARIAGATGLDALTTEEFTRRTEDYVIRKTGILINFGITIGLGFVIGVLVAGQTFYTFVLDNLKHFGALKAMGTSAWTILRMLTLQVLTVGGIGYGVGVGLAGLTGLALGNVGLAFNMVWPIPVFGAVAVIGCCMIAGAIGMVRVLRLEPAVVFKG